MTRFLVTVAVVGIVAGAGLGAEIKSGPAVGEGVAPFNPVNVAGPYKGTKACPV